MISFAFFFLFSIQYLKIKVHDMFSANISLNFVLHYKVGIKGFVFANYTLGYFDEQIT